MVFTTNFDLLLLTGALMTHPVVKKLAFRAHDIAVTFSEDGPLMQVYGPERQVLEIELEQPAVLGVMRSLVAGSKQLALKDLDGAGEV